MTYTEKELDQFLHGISLSLLSKKSAQHWRYDEETAKEIEWLEALERKVRADKADRKTENSSEKPNNCELQTIRCPKCGRTDYIRDMEKDMGIKGSHYKYKCINCNTYIKDEPTISKMEQVDKDINVRSKDKPQTYVINPQEPTNDDKCFECDDFFTCGGQCNKIEDEQTESDRIDNEIEYAWKTYCDTDE